MVGINYGRSEGIRLCLDKPYNYGYQHMKIALHKENTWHGHKIHLKDRVKHFTLGLAEWVPVLNIIVALTDRAMNKFTYDSTIPVVDPAPREEEGLPASVQPPQATKESEKRKVTVLSHQPSTSQGAQQTSASSHQEVRGERVRQPSRTSGILRAPSGKIYNFAYGSNMLKSRLEERVGKVNRIGKKVILKDYEFQFSKLGSDGSGKANVHKKSGQQVEGALFELSQDQLSKLDKFEGYPDHYTRKTITVTNERGEEIEAIVYVAKEDKIRSGLKPTKEYLNYIVAGGRETEISQIALNHIQSLAKKE